MKVLFLGAGHGVPTEDRFCSATLLECGGVYYLIDAGAPVGQLFVRYGIPFEKLKAVFITHRHGDHMAGLPHLVDLSTWCYKESNYDVFMTEQQGVDALRTYLLSLTDNGIGNNVRLHTFEAGKVFEDENIVVTAIATNHMNGSHPSYAFMIEGEGKRVFFTGDLHCGDAVDFPMLAKELPSDLLVCEFAHFHQQAIFKHLQQVKTKQIIFNHYNENFAPAMVEDMINGEKKLKFPACLAHDGDEITIS